MLQIIAARNKVGIIFSEAYVKNSVHGGCVYGWGGMRGMGACVVGCVCGGGVHGKGGMYDRGGVAGGGHVYIYFLFEHTV